MRSDWDLLPQREEPRRENWDVLPRRRHGRGLVFGVCAVTLALAAAVVGMAPDEGSRVAARSEAGTPGDEVAAAPAFASGTPASFAPVATVPSEGSNASPAAEALPTPPAPGTTQSAASPGPAAAPTPPAQPDTPAGEPPKPGDVPGEWIVELNDGESPDAVADDHDGEVRHVYTAAVDGYAAGMTDEEAEQVADDPRVARVTRDRVAYATAQTLPTGIKRIGAPTVGTGESVDVDVAVVDTGISPHADLNIAGGKNCNGTGTSYADGAGHGTHVAGTIGAKNDTNGVVGVAPGARLWAVRVLGNTGSGTFSQIVCGLDWVRAQGNIEVVNMSLSGSGTDGSCGNSTLHNAICNLKNAGTTIVVAAGNSSANASGEVPAAYEQVITVSALADFNGLAGGGASPTCRSDVDDTFASFSNYGSDVDIIAPGVCILSTSRTGGTTTMSGTSMAAPHVAGAAGLYKAGNPGATPDQVRSALIAAGNSDWNDVDDPDSTKEPLLAAGPPPPPPPPPDPTVPTASITSATCNGLTCSFTGSGNDADGGSVTYAWDFGDSTNGSGASVSHTYASPGPRSVVLTVTDTDSPPQSATATTSVNPQNPPPVTISLTATVVRGWFSSSVRLNWSGATGSSVDVWRKSSTGSFTKLGSTPNDGVQSYTTSRGTWTFKVCLTNNTTTCSPERTVTV